MQHNEYGHHIYTVIILLLRVCLWHDSHHINTACAEMCECVSLSRWRLNTQFLWSHHIGLCKYMKHKNTLVMNNFPWRQCEVSHSYLFCYFILVWRQRGRFLCQEGCFHLLCMVSFQWLVLHVLFYIQSTVKSPKLITIKKQKHTLQLYTTTYTLDIKYKAG